MNRLKALEILREYSGIPAFSVKIGVCSPQVEFVDLEGALKEFDRCAEGFDTDKWEFVYIYCDEIFADHARVNEALDMFNLGARRHLINSDNCARS